MKQKIMLLIAIVLYTFLGIYFGASSIVRVDIEDQIATIDAKKDSLVACPAEFKLRGEKYESQYDLKIAIVMQTTGNFFVVENNLLATLIAACSFGLIGAVIALMISITNNGMMASLKIWSQPFLGALTGLVVVALVYLLPTLLVKTEGDARPYTLMFLALLCGIYTREFYAFLRKTFIGKLLKNDSHEKIEKNEIPENT